MRNLKVPGATALFFFLNLLMAAQVGAENARLDSVKTLIEHSTAARHVQNSTNAEAKRIYEQARALYSEALAASQAGETEKMQDLLSQASQKMFAAVRLLGPEGTIIEKQRSDYIDRFDSVNALVEAYDRISSEKSVATKNRDELHQLVQAKLKEAEVLKATGDFKAGRKVLDEAYVAAKVSLEQLRGGDTLVRSLDFKSKKEEYDYELDRNDTHKLLVEVLLREKMSGNKRVKSQVTKYMTQAASIREKAEKHAAAGDFDAAVKALEESTREIVRAIRSAGVFIPG